MQLLAQFNWTYAANVSDYVLTVGTQVVYPTGSDTSINLILDSDTQYTATLIAKNSYGESSPAILEFTTPPFIDGGTPPSTPDGFGWQFLQWL